MTVLTNLIILNNFSDHCLTDIDRKPIVTHPTYCGKLILYFW